MKDAFKNSTTCRILLYINMFVALYTIETFLPISRGESVRAMGWSFFTVVIASISLFVGIVTAAIEIWYREYNTAILSFILSLIPIPLAILILVIFMKLKEFQLAP
jgi:hypothetical protein